MTHMHRSTVCLTLAASLFVACDQPEPKCNVARGAFWAKYTLLEGEGACAELLGEQLDVQSYYSQRSGADTRPNFDDVSIAIQPMSITGALWNGAGVAEPNAGDLPYALGKMTTTTPRADFCEAPELSTARLRLDAVPEHPIDECTTAPAAPAVDVTYVFSNVRVYYTPAAIGTQFEADLTYTQDDCTAKYKVTAVYPMVACGNTPAPPDDAEEDASTATGEEEAPAEDDAEGTDDAPVCESAPETAAPEADDTLCENAGIDPDYAVACDPDTLMCILKKSSPSLK